MNLVIRGGRVVSHTETNAADIAITDGRITALLAPGTPVPGCEEVDAQGLWVLPGLVDAHVHLRSPGYPQKETIATGTAAAACGGVTAMIDMPNTLPPVTSTAELTAKAAMLPQQAHVDVGFYALLHTGDAHNLESMADAGCLGYKLFLGPTTGNLQAPGWGELYAAGSTLARLGLPLVVHAENREVVEYWEPRARRQGADYQAFLAARPAFGELAATADACLLARETGAHVHIAHVALAQAVDIIAHAQVSGWPVSAETCPPYLFLSADDYHRIGNYMKVLPPVRSVADQTQLWYGLRSGAINIVATDHAPHTTADKAGGIWEAAAGAPGVETLLPLMLDAAAHGRCTLPDIVRWCSNTPARLCNLVSKGEIAPGFDADLVLVDTAATWQIAPEKLHSRSSCTPFAGRRCCGQVKAVYLRGELIAADGELVGAPPGGRWLRPQGQQQTS